MKHKIFILSLFVLVTVGSFVMADYVDPSSSAPNSNTGYPVKTGPDTPIRTVEKITTGFNCGPQDCSTGGLPGNFFGIGLYSDKLVAMGASQIDGSLKVFKRTGAKFDQYVNTFSFIDPNTQTQYNSKPIEAIVPGLFTSPVIISSQESSQPAYTLQLEALPSNNFTPTTNIGLGDTCKIYPLDLGITIGAYNTGCPSGSYMSMYKNPSFSGTLSSSNNTNTQVVSQCTYFEPSASPTNNTNCYTTGITQVSTGSNHTLAFHNYSPGFFAIKQITPGNCILKARISAYQLKNPVMTIKNSSGTTIYGPTATTQVNNLSVGCVGSNSITVTDDYGQYFSALNSAGWDDVEWGYVW